MKVGNNLLFDNVNISFEKERINHILGSNGVGKSCFAKSTIGLLKYAGKIEGDSDISLIGSYSGVPQDFKLLDIRKILELHFNSNHIKSLCQLLNTSSIPNNIPIRKMSDGQKQKIKLLVFLASKPETIILDEFTSALDKNSSLEIYKFLNDYIKVKGTLIINITHNLSDVENMPGSYFYISNKKITKILDKDKIFDLYIKGE